MALERTCGRTAVGATGVWKYPSPINTQGNNVFVTKLKARFVLAIDTLTNPGKSYDA
jgi:hypothetical protein